MSLTSKKISVKNIIAKVYQDLDLSNDIDIGRLIEWSAEALNKINVYQQLETKRATICINNYKSEIPCDLVYLTSIGYKGVQLDKSSGNDIYNARRSSNFYTDPRAVNQDKITNSAFIYGMSYMFKTGDSFLMENGWFKTSFSNGDIDIQYQAMSMDNEGYPLIPDNESFRDAIFWYIVHKYFYIKAISEERFKWLYQDADVKWRYYVTQSGAEAMMPDVHTLENIKRNYLQLLPKVNSYESFFSDLNKNSNNINSNAK